MQALPLRRDVLLRGAVLLVSAALALILANAAASLYEVWQLRLGALMPGPWDTLLGSSRVDQRSHMLSLLGGAFFAGASLSCAVFLVDRLVRELWAWLRELVRP